MKATALVRALAVTTLLASGCGTASPGPSGSVATPSSGAPSRVSSSATSSPRPLGICTPTNHCLALVRLNGSNELVIRDITDIAHPKTVGTLGSVQTAVFVSASEVSYASDDGNLYRAPLAGSPKSLVTSHAGPGAWSPDGSGVLYTTDDGAGTLTIHQFKGGRDQVLGTMPNRGGGGCEAIASCTLPNWLDFRLAYSPDGAQISLVVDSFGVSVFRVWSSDGKLLTSDDSKETTMSAWSGPTLYFEGSSGVESWHDGVVSTFMPRTAWVRPSASPAGGQIVYTVRDASGWGHILVVDTATGKARELKSARTDAAFLTSRYIWYQGERACTVAENCGSTPPFHPLSGTSYIYDLQDGTETASVITAVADVWPHAA